MARQIYEVEGIISIRVKKRVKANERDEAIRLADKYFNGLTCYCGNGGTDKLIGVSDYSESVEDCGDYVEWTDAYVTENNDYDERTEPMTIYTCKLCGEEFECENEEAFEDYVEADLWNHLEEEHEEKGEEYGWNDTEKMISECFDVREVD